MNEFRIFYTVLKFVISWDKNIIQIIVLKQILYITLNNVSLGMIHFDKEEKNKTIEIKMTNLLVFSQFQNGFFFRLTLKIQIMYVKLVQLGISKPS